MTRGIAHDEQAGLRERRLAECHRVVGPAALVAMAPVAMDGVVDGVMDPPMGSMDSARKIGVKSIAAMGSARKITLSQLSSYPLCSGSLFYLLTFTPAHHHTLGSRSRHS